MEVKKIKFTKIKKPAKNFVCRFFISKFKGKIINANKFI